MFEKGNFIGKIQGQEEQLSLTRALNPIFYVKGWSPGDLLVGIADEGET